MTFLNSSMSLVWKTEPDGVDVTRRLLLVFITHSFLSFHFHLLSMETFDPVVQQQHTKTQLLIEAPFVEP